ncbi:MAG: winged helix-turn-helix transcriptional regulator [Emcibacter sp.]|nr:winged helix-turn-helix transcriptional regulator [Emcibacter sp.]
MPENKNNDLILESFLPYRLSYLSNLISRELAGLYSEKFDISPHEWRILANLTRYPNISAAEVGEKVAMDKVAVSRAIKNLCDMGLVHKIFSPEDRRRSVLNLTEEGQDIYHKIEPLVVAYEASLLTILDETETAQLDHLLNKLTTHVVGS